MSTSRKILAVLPVLWCVTALPAAAQDTLLHCRLPNGGPHASFYDLRLNTAANEIDTTLHVGDGRDVQFTAKYATTGAEYRWGATVHLPHVIYNIKRENYVLQRETLVLVEIYPGVDWLGGDVKNAYQCQIAVNQI